MGYRYYNTFGVPVLFPFGYGLSYGDFSYSDLAIDKSSYGVDDTIKAIVTPLQQR